ncbi:MAG TPA: sialidase family protein, partial [Streptomyces sp.]|nr:sialidase family protein [Streptomyces sp.]
MNSSRRTHEAVPAAPLGAGSGFPLPGSGRSATAVPAPGKGPQQWAGAPSSLCDADGSLVLAYRIRAGGEDCNVVARSVDGRTFTTLAVITSDSLGAMMVERPALVRTDSGAWRLYVCCATTGTKHWWTGVLEAPSLEGLPDAAVRPVFEGDRHTAVKDPVVRRTAAGGWEAWLCCHPLDEPGHEDRMSTAYATSDDGLRWQWHGTVLAGRHGAWDARGARLTSVLPDGRACYDGRATAEENWFERTGLAAPDATGRGAGLVPLGGEPVADVR